MSCFRRRAGGKGAMPSSCFKLHACCILQQPGQHSCSTSCCCRCHYYCCCRRSSRLHFIGSWKARVEALMADHYQQQQQQAPRNPAAAAGGAGAGQHPLMCGAGAGSSKRGKSGAAAGGGAAQGRVIVHIDMDCFFAAVSTVGRPEFAGGSGTASVLFFAVTSA